MNRKDDTEPELHRRIWLLNEYRAAEIHGVGVIMRMARLADDSTLSLNLSRHLRDEATHAWLWTKVIDDMGGEITEIDIPYQTRLGIHFGIPRTFTEMLALTYVSERRGVREYTEHLDDSDITSLVQRTLRGILKDEHWHVRYIEEELRSRARGNDAVQGIIDRALDADELAIADLAVAEKASGTYQARP